MVETCIIFFNICKIMVNKTTARDFLFFFPEKKLLTKIRVFRPKRSQILLLLNLQESIIVMVCCSVRARWLQLNTNCDHCNQWDTGESVTLNYYWVFQKVYDAVAFNVESEACDSVTHII